MTHFLQAIKDAQANGWRQPEPCELDGIKVYHRGDALIDPAFWQALGKARGWEELDENNPPEDQYTHDAWKENWHRFIDHLADGKNAESFFATLE